MSSAAANLGRTLWRLVVANPILVRVVHGQSRRTRHLWLRIGYLSVLFLVMLVAVVGLGTKSGSGSSLNELAKTYNGVFQTVSFVQLGLMCFLAPVFTAAAITQERDAQTFNILLTTPMSNAQIVLGSLCSRLYFVIMLLLAGVPIFCITMLHGGVTTPVIFRSFAIAGATAVITGSIAIAYSVVKVGTKRTIFTFYLVIGLYLLAVYALGRITPLPEAPPNAGGTRMSWLACVHPFLSLGVALNTVSPPEIGEVAHYGWPAKYCLAYPDYSYLAITLLLSALLVTVSMFFVRHGVKEGELTALTRMRLWLTGLVHTPGRRVPRRVWRNPVAWREAATRTSIGGSGLVRYAYTLLGVGLAVGLLVVSLTWWSPTPDVTRDWLVAVVMAEFALVLLIATNTAASAITREREANTMDMLLCTPLTSRDLIRGKLRGLISFTLPLIAVPVATCLLFAVADLLRRGKTSVIFPEAVVFITALMVFFAAFACILGLQRSVRSQKTVNAVLASVGILVLVCFGSVGCLFSVIGQTREFGAMLAPFTPFTALAVAIDPGQWLGIEKFSSAKNAQVTVRVLSAIGSMAACGVYALIVVGLYKSMVRNFDMTVRKQSV